MLGQACALQMLEFPGEGVNLRKSPVFCKNLRFGLSLSLCHLSPVPLSAPGIKIGICQFPEIVEQSG